MLLQLTLSVNLASKLTIETLFRLDKFIFSQQLGYYLYSFISPNSTTGRDKNTNTRNSLGSVPVYWPMDKWPTF